MKETLPRENRQDSTTIFENFSEIDLKPIKRGTVDKVILSGDIAQSYLSLIREITKSTPLRKAIAIDVSEKPAKRNLRFFLDALGEIEAMRDSNATLDNSGAILQTLLQARHASISLDYYLDREGDYLDDIELYMWDMQEEKNKQNSHLDSQQEPVYKGELRALNENRKKIQRILNRETEEVSIAETLVGLAEERALLKIKYAGTKLGLP